MGNLRLALLELCWFIMGAGGSHTRRETLSRSLVYFAVEGRLGSRERLLGLTEFDACVTVGDHTP